MADRSPFTAMLARAPRQLVERALASALSASGYVGAPGLKLSAIAVDLDPHERGERAFRLEIHGDWVAICELGAETAADFFLVAALMDAGVDRVAYVALAGAPPSGVVALQREDEAPLELWLESGVPDSELSDLLAPDSSTPSTPVESSWAIEQLAAFDEGAGALLGELLADGGSPEFARAGGESLAFVRRD